MNKVVRKSKQGETEVRKTALTNGLIVITERMPAVRSVSIGIWLRTGSRAESAAENGITHFLEHMVFKGTCTRSAEEIARAADSIGGHLDAFTAKEQTSFSIKVLDEHSPRAFEILADLVKNPLLRNEHVAKESQVIQEEIKMVEDTPDDLVQELFTQSYWRNHPLGRPILGTRRTVAAFNRARLFRYFRRHYTPRNMLVTAAGNLKHNRILELVDAEFGAMPGGSPATSPRAPVAWPGLRFRRKRNLEQVHICVGAPAYPLTHSKRFASYVLNTILGGGMSSRLFQNVREKRGLAYAVFSGLNSYADAGCLNVYAGTSTANARTVVQLIIEEFARLKNETLTNEELVRTKDYLKGSTLLALESTTSRMSNLARQQIYFGRHISMDELARQVDAVSAEDVQAVARDLFEPGRIALTVLGPLSGTPITRSDLTC
jgi:predicted Zn-dependent peptidase